MCTTAFSIWFVSTYQQAIPGLEDAPVEPTNPQIISISEDAPVEPTASTTGTESITGKINKAIRRAVYSYYNSTYYDIIIKNYKVILISVSVPVLVNYHPYLVKSVYAVTKTFLEFIRDSSVYNNFVTSLSKNFKKFVAWGIKNGIVVFKYAMTKVAEIGRETLLEYLEKIINQSMKYCLNKEAQEDYAQYDERSQPPPYHTKEKIDS